MPASIKTDAPAACNKAALPELLEPKILKFTSTICSNKVNYLQLANNKLKLFL